MVLEKKHSSLLLKIINYIAICFLVTAYIDTEKIQLVFTTSINLNKVISN